MNSLNSDELRQLMRGNILKMNALTAENDAIVDMLKHRGLKAVDGPEIGPDMDFLGSFLRGLEVLSTKLAKDQAAIPEPHEVDHSSPEFRVQFEPKRREEIPLTIDELSAGEWWTKDLSDESYSAFAAAGIVPHDDRETWADGYYDCFSMDYEGFLVLWKESARPERAVKEIHRIGSNFYWSKQ